MMDKGLFCVSADVDEPDITELLRRAIDGRSSIGLRPLRAAAVVVAAVVDVFPAGIEDDANEGGVDDESAEVDFVVVAPDPPAVALTLLLAIMEAGGLLI